MSKTSHFVTLVGAVALLSACSMAPDYERTSFAMPDLWPFGPTVDATRDQKQTDSLVEWWKNYNDPALTALIEEGLKQSGDLEVSAARVAQARAQVDYADANRFPLLSVEGTASRSKNAYGTSGGGLATNKPFNNFGLSAVLDYEIDLWGRLASASHAADARLLAASYNRDAVRLAVASEIAQGYFNLRALDAEATVTENTITSREQGFNLEQSQYNHGATDGLTLRQSQSELAAARAQLPQLRQAREEQASALAVLLGRSPRDIIISDVARGADIDTLPVPPAVPTELPSTLLERRPDIAAAEQTLIANNADIGTVRASYFPVISLSGLIGLSSLDVGHLFDSTSHTWSLGGTATGPLVDFGRTNANVDLAFGVKDEQLAVYKNTVRTAFKDVRDALVAQQNTADRQNADAAQVDAESESLRLANLRYNAGYSDHLEVLDAQRGLYGAQIDRIDAKLSRLIASLNLYKALGGGWSAEAAAKSPE